MPYEAGLSIATSCNSGRWAGEGVRGHARGDRTDAGKLQEGALSTNRGEEAKERSRRGASERNDRRRELDGLRHWTTACLTRRTTVSLRRVILGGWLVKGSAVKLAAAGRLRGGCTKGLFQPKTKRYAIYKAEETSAAVDSAACTARRTRKQDGATGTQHDEIFGIICSRCNGTDHGAERPPAIPGGLEYRSGE